MILVEVAGQKDDFRICKASVGLGVKTPPQPFLHFSADVLTVAILPEGLKKSVVKRVENIPFATNAYFIEHAPISVDDIVVEPSSWLESVQ